MKTDTQAPPSSQQSPGLSPPCPEPSPRVLQPSGPFLRPVILALLILCFAFLVLSILNIAIVNSSGAVTRNMESDKAVSDSPARKILSNESPENDKSTGDLPQEEHPGTSDYPAGVKLPSEPREQDGLSSSFSVEVKPPNDVSEEGKYPPNFSPAEKTFNDLQRMKTPYTGFVKGGESKRVDHSNSKLRVENEPTRSKSPNHIDTRLNVRQMRIRNSKMFPKEQMIAAYDLLPSREIRNNPDFFMYRKILMTPSSQNDEKSKVSNDKTSGLKLQKYSSLDHFNSADSASEKEKPIELSPASLFYRRGSWKRAQTKSQIRLRKAYSLSNGAISRFILRKLVLMKRERAMNLLYLLQQKRKLMLKMAGLQKNLQRIQKVRNLFLQRKTNRFMGQQKAQRVGEAAKQISPPKLLFLRLREKEQPIPRTRIFQLNRIAPTRLPQYNIFLFAKRYRYAFRWAWRPNENRFVPITFAVKALRQGKMSFNVRLIWDKQMVFDSRKRIKTPGGMQIARRLMLIYPSGIMKNRRQPTGAKTHPLMMTTNNLRLWLKFLQLSRSGRGGLQAGVSGRRRKIVYVQKHASGHKNTEAFRLKPDGLEVASNKETSPERPRAKSESDKKALRHAKFLKLLEILEKSNQTIKTRLAEQERVVRELKTTLENLINHQNWLNNKVVDKLNKISTGLRTLLDTFQNIVHPWAAALAQYSPYLRDKVNATDDKQTQKARLRAVKISIHSEFTSRFALADGIKDVFNWTVNRVKEMCAAARSHVSAIYLSIQSRVKLFVKWYRNLSHSFMTQLQNTDFPSTSDTMLRMLLSVMKRRVKTSYAPVAQNISDIQHENTKMANESRDVSPALNTIMKLRTKLVRNKRRALVKPPESAGREAMDTMRSMPLIMLLKTKGTLKTPNNDTTKLRNNAIPVSMPVHPLKPLQEFVTNYPENDNKDGSKQQHEMKHSVTTETESSSSTPPVKVVQDMMDNKDQTLSNRNDTRHGRHLLIYPWLRVPYLVSRGILTISQIPHRIMAFIRRLEMANIRLRMLMFSRFLPVNDQVPKYSKMAKHDKHGSVTGQPPLHDTSPSGKASSTVSNKEHEIHHDTKSVDSPPAFQFPDAPTAETAVEVKRDYNEEKSPSHIKKPVILYKIYVSGKKKDRLHNTHGKRYVHEQPKLTTSSTIEDLDDRQERVLAEKDTHSNYLKGQEKDTSRTRRSIRKPRNLVPIAEDDMGNNGLDFQSGSKDEEPLKGQEDEYDGNFFNHQVNHENQMSASQHRGFGQNKIVKPMSYYINRNLMNNMNHGPYAAERARLHRLRSKMKKLRQLMAMNKVSNAKTVADVENKIQDGSGLNSIPRKTFHTANPTADDADSMRAKLLHLLQMVRDSRMKSHRIANQNIEKGNDKEDGNLKKKNHLQPMANQHIEKGNDKEDSNLEEQNNLEPGSDGTGTLSSEGDKRRPGWRSNFIISQENSTEGRPDLEQTTPNSDSHDHEKDRKFQAEKENELPSFVLPKNGENELPSAQGKDFDQPSPGDFYFGPKVQHNQPTEADKKLLDNIAMLTYRFLGRPDKKGSTGLNLIPSDENDEFKHEDKDLDAMNSGESFSDYENLEQPTFDGTLEGVEDKVKENQNNVAPRIRDVVGDKAPNLFHTQDDHGSSSSKNLAIPTAEKMNDKRGKAIHRRRKRYSDYDADMDYDLDIKADLLNTLREKWLKTRREVKRLRGKIFVSRENYNNIAQDLDSLLRKGDALADVDFRITSRNSLNHKMQKANWNRAAAEFKKYKKEVKAKEQQFMAEENKALFGKAKKKIRQLSDSLRTGGILQGMATQQLLDASSLLPVGADPNDRLQDQISLMALKDADEDAVNKNDEAIFGNDNSFQLEPDYSEQSGYRIVSSGDSELNQVHGLLNAALMRGKRATNQAKQKNDVVRRKMLRHHRKTMFKKEIDEENPGLRSPDLPYNHNQKLIWYAGHFRPNESAKNFPQRWRKIRNEAQKLRRRLSNVIERYSAVDEKIKKLITNKGVPLEKRINDLVYKNISDDVLNNVAWSVARRDFKRFRQDVSKFKSLIERQELDMIVSNIKEGIDKIKTALDEQEALINVALTTREDPNFILPFPSTKIHHEELVPETFSPSESINKVKTQYRLEEQRDNDETAALQDQIHNLNKFDQDLADSAVVENVNNMLQNLLVKDRMSKMATGGSNGTLSRTRRAVKDEEKNNKSERDSKKKSKEDKEDEESDSVSKQKSSEKKDKDGKGTTEKKSSENVKENKDKGAQESKPSEKEKKSGADTASKDTENKGKGAPKNKSSKKEGEDESESAFDKAIQEKSEDDTDVDTSEEKSFEENSESRLKDSTFKIDSKIDEVLLSAGKHHNVADIEKPYYDDYEDLEAQKHKKNGPLSGSSGSVQYNGNSVKQTSGIELVGWPDFGKNKLDSPSGSKNSGTVILDSTKHEANQQHSGAYDTGGLSRQYSPDVKVVDVNNYQPNSIGEDYDSILRPGLLDELVSHDTSHNDDKNLLPETNEIENIQRLNHKPDKGQIHGTNDNADESSAVEEFLTENIDHPAEGNGLLNLTPMDDPTRLSDKVVESGNKWGEPHSQHTREIAWPDRFIVKGHDDGQNVRSAAASETMSRMPGYRPISGAGNHISSHGSQLRRQKEELGRYIPPPIEDLMADAHGSYISSLVSDGTDTMDNLRSMSDVQRYMQKITEEAHKQEEGLETRVGPLEMRKDIDEARKLRAKRIEAVRAMKEHVRKNPKMYAPLQPVLSNKAAISHEIKEIEKELTGKSPASSLVDVEDEGGKNDLQPFDDVIQDNSDDYMYDEFLTQPKKKPLSKADDEYLNKLLTDQSKANIFALRKAENLLASQIDQERQAEEEAILQEIKRQQEQERLLQVKDVEEMKHTAKEEAAAMKDLEKVNKELSLKKLKAYKQEVKELKNALDEEHAHQEKRRKQWLKDMKLLQKFQ